MTFLHTWDQKILDHFHIHCIIPAGALCKSGEKWIDCQYDYLFPERALAKVFQGKFMDYFQQAYQKTSLIFAGNTEKFATPEGFYQLKTLFTRITQGVNENPSLRLSCQSVQKR